MEQTFRSASFNLGNVHLGLNEPREALRHFMKLRNLTPEFLHGHLAEQFTGAALAQLGRAEEAIHAWDNAIAARKAQRNGTHDHDFWLAVSGHATRAAADAAAAAQRSPSSASHAVTAGLLKFAIGQIDGRGCPPPRGARAPPRPPVGARPPAARPGRGEQGAMSTRRSATSAKLWRSSRSGRARGSSLGVSSAREGAATHASMLT